MKRNMCRYHTYYILNICGLLSSFYLFRISFERLYDIKDMQSQIKMSNDSLVITQETFNMRLSTVMQKSVQLCMTIFMKNCCLYPDLSCLFHYMIFNPQTCPTNPMHDAVLNLKYRGDGDFDLNYLFQGSNENHVKHRN